MSKLINEQSIPHGNMNKITARPTENSALLHMLLLVVFDSTGINSGSPYCFMLEWVVKGSCHLSN